MGRLRASLFANLSLITASLAVGNNLGSCVDVQCPLSPGTQTQAACHVYNETMNAIGVTEYEVLLPNLDQTVRNSNDSEPTSNLWSGGDTNVTLSWTVGVSNYHHLVNASSPNLRNIDRIYYLSSPPTLDLTSSNLTYAGCALYMTGHDHKSVFYDMAANQRSKHSYCQTLMGYSCHDAIEQSARAFAQQLTADGNSSASVAASCSAMAAHLQSTLSSSCPNIDASTTFTGVALTGPGAASPITTEQNSTSDCHPTTQKENELTRSFSYNVTTSVYSNETLPALLGETPLWSVFYKLGNEDGGSSSIIEDESTAVALQEPDVQLLCLRPVDENMLDSLLPKEETSTTVGADLTGAAIRNTGSVWWGPSLVLMVTALSGL